MTVRSRVPAPLRALSHDFGSTLLAVVLLGLALGTAAAAFSLLHATVLAPLPFADQDRLALIWRTDPKAGVPVIEMSYRDAIDIRARTTAFTDLAVLGSVNWDLGLFEPGPATLVPLAGVSGDFFPTLQTPALLGRTLGPIDDTPTSSMTLVISHALWEQRFGGDPAIIGRTIQISADHGTRPAVIVGVMPRAFDFPRGATVWAPMRPLMGANTDATQSRGLFAFYWLGRLRPHVTPQDAERELTLLLPQVNPDRTGTRRPVVTPLPGYLLGPSRAAMWAIFALALLVWLLACANVSGLLLVQWSRRSHDLAIQRALGAGTRTIVAQWLVQACVMTAGAGVVAIAIAESARRVVLALAGSTVPRLQDATLDAPVLLFGLLMSAIAVAVAAALPAWHAARVTPMDVLKRRAGRTRSRTQAWVVAVELTLAIVTLAVAGRLVRAVLDLDRLDYGFKAQNVLSMDVRSSGNWNNFYETLFLPGIRALPGVVAAGATTIRPLRYDAIGDDSSVLLDGQSIDDQRTLDANPLVSLEAVTPGYFEAAGMAAQRGRLVGEHDRARSPRVLVVGERTARTLWPGQDPIGQRLVLGEDAKQRDPNGQLRWRTVVGVVKDVRSRGVTDVRLDVYMPVVQSSASVKHLLVRTTSDPLALADPIRRLAREIDGAVRIQDVTTMSQVVSEATRVWRLTRTIALAFGALAILIAGIGLYALLAHAVLARRYELAVRATLGARPLQLSGLVLRDALILAAGAGLLGLIAAVPASRLVATLDVSHHGVDLAALAGVVALLAGVAILASLLPAVRAAQSRPAAILRQD